MIKLNIIQKITSLILALLISGCDSPLGNKSVANPTDGDFSSDGNANPAKCEAVSFTPQTRLNLATQVDSDTLIISGCLEPVSISVAGDGSPQLYKNGIIVVGPTSISNGDTLRLSLTSSSLENTNYQALVSIGINKSIFSVTTGDFTPGAFSFNPATGQALSFNVVSNQATLAGFDGSLTATASGPGSPVILINGVVVGASASVVPGNAISVRLTSAATVNTTRQATITINGVSAYFDVTTTGDASTPTITSFLTPINGSYKQATQLDFAVNFSENIIAIGSPRIILNIGGITKYAGYLSGSGTATLIFRYIVEASMNDANGIGVGVIQLNGGTVSDAAGNEADLLFIPPDTSAVLVDTASPFVQSVTGPANDTYFLGQNLNFSLIFNEPVNATSSPRLILTIGTTNRYANYVSGTGTSTLSFRYTIQAGDNDFNGVAISPTIDLNSGTILDNATNSVSLAFSIPNTTSVNVAECPTNYVHVTALAPYTTSPFCVSKYEMKNISGIATAQAAGTPWVFISRDASITTCANLGPKYSLISNAQWQTIARNIESVGFNWSGSAIGNPAGISIGHSDNSPSNALAAVTNDNDSCSGTGQVCSLSTWNSQRRVHQLASGAYIWDFAGNIWEWVIDNNTTNFGADAYVSAITAVNRPTSGTIGGVLNTASYHFGPAGNYTAITTFPYVGLGYGDISYSTGVIRRGGRWGTSGGIPGAGVFAVFLNNTASAQIDAAGFRCTWTP